MSQVFLFGAGASYEYFGMAGRFFLDRSFFTAVDDMWAWWMNRDALVRRPPDHYDGGQWTLPAFEQLLAEVCGSDYRDKGLEATYSAVVQQRPGAEPLYLRAIELTLFHKLRDVSPASIPTHMELVRKAVRPDDTLVTFNYDPLLEHALVNASTELGCKLRWQESDGYGVPVRPFEGEAQGPSDQPSNVRVLKLHGSVDWLAKFGEIPAPPYRALRILPNSIRGQGFVVRRHEGVAYRPVIVPPLPKKQYAVIGIEPVWVQAREALARAASLTIIGYSLPKTDDRPRELLREVATSLNPGVPVTFVTMSDGEAFTRVQAIFPSATLFEGGFTAYVRALPMLPQ